MDTKSLTAGLSVSEQITLDDIKAIKNAGFRAIICNRPDGEGADQPTFEEIANTAKKAALEAVYLPIVTGKVTDEDAVAFGKTMTELPSPVLAYCRTGKRSATLWSLSQAGQRSLADILAATKAAGYDMAGVVRRIVNGGKTPIDMDQTDRSVCLFVRHECFGVFGNLGSFDTDLGKLIVAHV